MPVALVTGASRGFGCALAAALAGRGWSLVVDGRDRTTLEAAAALMGGAPAIAAVAGDVADPRHRELLAHRAAGLGRLDLLVNNASELGPSPLRSLTTLPAASLEAVYRVNALAPLALIQLVLPGMTAGGCVVNLSSDAAVEAYPGWGAYGSSKAALDQLTAVLAAEHPELGWYAFDPGDMRTEMHQAAYPGEDISDRPLPETVVPALLRLLEERPASGRYRAADLMRAAVPAT